MLRKSLLLMALVALSFPVRAEDSDAVGVVVLPYATLFGEIPQSKADKVTELLRGELEANSNKAFKVLEATEGKSKKAATARNWEEDLAAAVREIDAAKAQFEKAGGLAKGKKFKPAGDAYDAGIKQFLAAFQGADDFKPLSDAYVQLAISHGMRGNDDEAFAVLSDIVRIDPSRELKPPEVVPLFAKLHDKARREYLAKERGAMRFESFPAGAQVFIDGRLMGETPLLAKGIVPGEHFVKVIKTGSGAVWKKVAITGGVEELMRAELAGPASGALASISRTLQTNAVDDKLVQDARRVGEGSKADFVLFGALRKVEDGFVVKTYALQVKSGTIALLTTLEVDEELLSAGIKVLDLANDLESKVKGFSGAKPDGALPLWADARAQGGDGELTVVTVTGAAGAAPSATAPAGEGGGERRPGRRVVSAAPVEPPKPVVEEKKAEEPKPEPKQEKKEDEKKDEETTPHRRVRTRLGDKGSEAEKPVVEEAPKPVVEEPRIARRDERPKSKFDEIIAEEEKPKAVEPPPVVDTKPKGDRRYSDLSMDELKRLNAMDEKRVGSGGPSAGKVVLWTSVGVVAAAGLSFLGYTLLANPAPTSATATITW